MAQYIIGPVSCTATDPGTELHEFSGRVILNTTTDAANNATTIDSWRFEIYITRQAYISHYTYQNNNRVTVVINGTTVVSSPNIKAVAMEGHYESGNPGPFVLCSGGPITIPHNADGGKNLAVSANYTQSGAGNYIGTIAPSGTVTLETIPRAAVISSATNVTLPASGSVNETVSWTPLGGFYYKVEYKQGSSTRHTSAGLGASADSYTWGIPSSEISRFSGTSKTATYTAILHTYSDSAWTNELGTSSKTFTVTLGSGFAPTLGSPSVSQADTLSGTVVAGKSKSTVTVTPTYATGTSFDSGYAVYMDGTTELGARVSGNPAEGITLGIIPAFTNTTKTIGIKYSVTDKRGFTKTGTTTFTVYGWSSPSITSISAYRCDSTGAENERGQYYKVTFAYTIRTLNNSNAKTVKIQYKYYSEQTWTQSTSGNLQNYSGTVTMGPYRLSTASDDKLEIWVQVADSLTGRNPAEANFTILPAVVFIDILTDGDEKVGLGIGKVSTKADAVELGWDLELHGNGKAVINPDTGITFYDRNGVVSGLYPPDGSGGGSGGGSGSGGNGFTYAFKMALLNCFSNVAWINQNGRTYYNALVNAINDPYPANVTSVSAVFSQGSAVIYAGSDIDDLRQYLTVTAHFSDNTSRTVTDYLLTGVLTAGTSTITVLYGGETTTFNVTVTASVIYEGNITLSQSTTPNVISSSAITYDTTKTYSIQYTFGSITPSGAPTTSGCIVGPANSSNAVRGGAMVWSTSASAWQVQIGGSATTISPAPANGDLVTVVMKFATNKLSVYVNNTAVITDATLSSAYYTNTARLIAGRENANMTVAPNHIIVSIGDIH